ncbi:Calx-beta domain-containing protein [Flagellimonas sp.]|uniref:Calx-beta domain-containing protein n=1 Tax=Flagellimonas sp. TaxID=2058762 RepID=UPI003BABB32A
MKKILFIAILLVGFFGQSQIRPEIYTYNDTIVDPVLNVPEITQVNITNITQTGAQVSISFDEGVAGRFEYWKTSEPSTTYLTARESNLLTTHAQPIGEGNPSGVFLESGTEYTFIPLFENAEGNFCNPTEYTFTTLGANQTASIAFTDNTGSESGDTLLATVTLAQPSVGTTSVNYSTNLGTDQVTASAATFEILNGQTTATVTFTPVDDDINEGDQNLTVTLNNGTGYTLDGTTQVSGTITDNDTGGGGTPLATIAMTDASGSESPLDNLTVRVTFSEPAVGDTDVNLSYTNSASINSDFTAPLTVTVLDGNTFVDFTITVINDNVIEGTEQVTVNVLNGTGYTPNTPSSATGSITSEDTGGVEPLMTVVATDFAGSELGNPIEYTIYASEPVGADTDITVLWDGSAKMGEDYPSQSSTVTMLSGNSSVVISFTPNDEPDLEPEESVILTLKDGTGYGLGYRIHADAYITSDDTHNLPTTTGTSTITSLADFTNPANAGTLATVTASFNASGATAAAGMVLRSTSDVQISGTNINLNGSGIQDGAFQLFSSTASFSSPYTLSRIRPDMFGATPNDATDDNTALVTFFNNVQHGTSTLNGSYIKNNHTNFNRSGLFDWDMNGASVNVTSSANFSLTQVSVDAVFDITNTSVRIYNGEFDGNDVYGRFFYLHGQEEYMFNDLFVHNLYAPNAIRCVAFRFTINVDGSGFRHGEFRNNTVQDIVAQGDGNYNDTFGISKWAWYSISGSSPSTQYMNFYKNNTITRIIGDDAEAWYAIEGGSNRDYDGQWVMMENNFSDCTRRAIKACLGQVSLYDNTITELRDVYYNSAQQMGSMVDFFSTNTSMIKNIRLVGNTIQTASGENAHYWMNAYTNAEDIIVAENTYRQNAALGVYNSLRIGGSGSYTGYLDNMRVIDNNFINSSIDIINNRASAASTTPIEMDGNDFDFNITPGYPYMAPLHWYGSNSAERGYINFSNSVINWNVATGTASGILASSPTWTVNANNVNISNVTVNFSGGLPTGDGEEIGIIPGIFTNGSFTNITVTGGSGTPIFNGGTTTGTTQSGNTPTITIN